MSSYISKLLSNMKKTLFLAVVLGACVNAGAYEYIKGNQTWDETTPDFGTTTHIGYAEGAGAVTAVTDADVTVNGTLFVGGKGWGITTPRGNNGTLTIQSDAFVTANGGDGYASLAVGASDYAVNGTVNVLSGGTLVAVDGMLVGAGTAPHDASAAVGKIVIEDDGYLAVTKGEVLIGCYTTGSGTVLVKKGGELNLGPQVSAVWVGQNGKGSLTIEGDVTDNSTSGTSLYVGSGTGTGTVSVASDAGAEFGGDVIVEDGGKLNLQSGSELEVGKSLTVSSSGAEVKMIGATVNVTESVNVVDGAKTTISNGTAITAGKAVVDNADVTLNNATIDADAVDLHHQAVVNMKNGAEIDAGDVKLHDTAALNVGDALVTADNITIENGSLTAENSSSQVTSDTMSVLGGGLLDVQDGGRVITTTSGVVESGATVKLVDDAEWHVGDTTTGTIDVKDGSTIVFGVTNKHIDEAGVVGTGHIEVSDGSTVNISTSANLVVDVQAEVIQRMLAGETELAINLVTSENPGSGTVNVGTGAEQASISVNGAGLEDIAEVLYQNLGSGDMLQIKVTADEEKLAELVAPDADAVATTMLADANALGTYANAIMAQVKMPRQGDHRLWGVGLADFERVTTKGNASGYRYNGGGYCVGYDRDVAKDTYLGVTAGQMYGVYQSKRSSLHDRQVATMAGVYGHTDWDAGKSGDNKVNLDGYALIGRIHHKAHTSVYGALPASGSWDSDAVKAGLFLSYDFNVDENTTITPFIGITVTYITQDDVTLKNSSIGYRYTDGDYTNVTLPIGATYTKTYDLGHGSSLVPHISLAYLADIYRDDVSVKTVVAGQEKRMTGVKPGRSGVMAEIGSSWVINPQWTTGLFYTMEHRRHDTDHTIHAHVSYGF